MRGAAAPSRTAWTLFGWTYPMLRRLHVHAVRFAGAAAPEADRVVLVANHTSWWDGFLLWELHRRLFPDRPLFTVMLERELRRTPALRRLGCVGVRPGTIAGVRDAVRRFEREVKTHRQLTLSFFPQGSIWPSARRPLGFKSGLRLFVRPLLPCALIPVALHLEAGRHRRPTAYVVAGPSRPANDSEEVAKEAERAVTHLLDGLQRFLGRSGEASDSLWPDNPADPLPELAVHA